MDLQYQIGPAVVVIKRESRQRGYTITIADRTYAVQLDHARLPEVVFTIDGVRHIAQVVSDGATHYVAIDGHALELKKPDPRRARKKHHHGEDSLSASMPGQVAK